MAELKANSSATIYTRIINKQRSFKMYSTAKANAAYLRGDYAAAAQMYLDGARDGIADAAFNYGYCLYRGIGVACDMHEAKSFFSFARDVDGGDAEYNLGMLYMRGEGVAKDYHRAYEHIRAAADAGCIEAQLYLGMAFTTGCMIEPDIAFISRIPYHKPEYRRDENLIDGYIDPDVAEQDEAARFSVIHADGREAFDWFRIAAYHAPEYVDDLVAKGKYLYAKCHIDGLGIDADIKRGAYLMLMAGRSGSEDAVAYLEANGVRTDMYLSSGRGRRRE